MFIKCLELVVGLLVLSRHLKPNNKKGKTLFDDYVDPVEVGVATTITYLVYTCMFLFFYTIIWWFWGDMFIIEFSDLWLDSSYPFVAEGLLSVWFIFVWAIAINFLSGYVNIDETRSSEPGTIFGLGLWISLNAGFFEELIYRWMMFFIAMAVLPFMNLISFGLVEWFYGEFLVPIANWATFGSLEPQLLSSNWVLGASVVFAASSFRDAHKYQGLLGYVNAWFMGMVLFYLMFNYGLVTAMVAHFLYDAVIFTTAALMMSFRPAPRRRRFLV